MAPPGSEGALQRGPMALCSWCEQGTASNPGPFSFLWTVILLTRLSTMSLHSLSARPFVSKGFVEHHSCCVFLVGSWERSVWLYVCILLRPSQGRKGGNVRAASLCRCYTRSQASSGGGSQRVLSVPHAFASCVAVTEHVTCGDRMQHVDFLSCTRKLRFKNAARVARG